MAYTVARHYDDLVAYQTLTERHIGIKYPIDYLTSSKVFLLKNSQSEICGGFIFAPTPPFRAIESIPDFEEYEHLYCSKSAEINGLWIIRDKQGSFESVLFWFYIAYKLLASGKSRFFFAYCNKHKGLVRFYQRLGIEKVYSGETRVVAGMKDVDDETIAYFSRRRILLIPWIYRSQITRRLWLSVNRFNVPSFGIKRT